MLFILGNYRKGARRMFILDYIFPALSQKEGFFGTSVGIDTSFSDQML